jgi:hypothetical protein
MGSVIEAPFLEHKPDDDPSGQSSGPSGCAVPQDWSLLWGTPDEEPIPIEWHKLKRSSYELASELKLTKLDPSFSEAVGSEHLRELPIHRWFTYKEGFSPHLLHEVIELLGLEAPLRVADPFGGVATTAMAALTESSVVEVRSIEYSPFARFVGETKLLWPSFSSKRLEELLPAALRYDPNRPVDVPELAAFSNRAIFSPKRIRTLVAARDHLLELDDADLPEREFFLLGLAAVLEDLSGAMKDGRALRIKRERVRRPSSLASTRPLVRADGPVKRALAGQWSAMIEDLQGRSDRDRACALATDAHHLAGDARNLESIELHEGGNAFPADWANLSLFSPPYLNCIDYTELYKLELWFLGHIKDQGSFRQTRLGTLRSHPSVRFGERNYFSETTGPVVDLVKGLSRWVAEQGLRPEIGPIVLQYFEDMLEVWRQQYRLIAPGGKAVCVVANSTFSRREKREDGSWREQWRVPILTDVILAHLSLLAGFQSVELMHARDLRPRNVKGGRARECLVVASKA